MNRIHAFLAQTLLLAMVDKAFNQVLDRIAVPWTKALDELEYWRIFRCRLQKGRAKQVYRANAGAFLLSHSLSSACDSNSATSMRSIVGPVSPTCPNFFLGHFAQSTRFDAVASRKLSGSVVVSLSGRSIIASRTRTR